MKACIGQWASRMSQFIEELLAPHVTDKALDESYGAMAADTEREAEAIEWCNALAEGSNEIQQCAHQM